MSNKDKPIEPDFKVIMNAIANALDDMLGPNGFVLMVFKRDQMPTTLNYISNTERSGVLDCMQTYIARNNKPELLDELLVKSRRVLETFFIEIPRNLDEDPTLKVRISVPDPYWELKEVVKRIETLLLDDNAEDGGDQNA